MTQFRFIYPILVRYGDFDPQWHVNHAHIITFIEQARTAYFVEVGMFDGKSFLDFPVIVGDVHCRYLAPIALGDPVIVSMGITKIGNKSLNFEYLVTGSNGTPVYATAETVMVCYSYHSHSSILVSDEHRKRISDFEGKTF